MPDGPASQPEPPASPPSPGPSLLQRTLHGAFHSALQGTRYSLLFLRKFIWLFSAILLLFHRPILEHSLRFLLQSAARREGLSLQLEISGNLLSHIVLRKIDLRPKAAPHPHVIRVQVEKLELHYSLPRLLWAGPKECLQAYSILHPSIHLQSPASSHPSSHDFAERLASLLAQPALYADSVYIHDLSLLLTSPLPKSAPLLALEGFFLSANPDQTGELRIDSLRFETHPGFQNLHALTRYPQRHLQIANLQLTPSLEIRSLDFDASERSKGKSRIALRLFFQNQELACSLSANQPQRAPAPTLRAELSTNGFALPDALQALGFEPGKLPHLEWAEAHLQGHPRQPSSWEGQADLRTRFPRGSSPNEPFFLEAHAGFHAGALYFDSLHGYTGTSTIALQGQISLASSLQSWDQLRGLLRLQAHAEDLSSLGIPPDWGSLFGTASATGTLAFDSGQAHTALQLDAQTLGSTPLQFAQGSLQVRLSTSLRHATNLQNLRGHLQLALQRPEIQCPQFQARFDQAQLHAEVRDGTLLIDPQTPLLLQKNLNTIKASASLPLPPFSPPSNPPPPPRPLHLEASLPRLEELAASLLGHPLSGSAQASFHGNLDSLSRSGALSASAGPLVWGGFDLGHLHIQADLQKDQALLQRFTLGWSPEEIIETSGSLSLSPAAAYAIRSNLRLSKLARLEPLLRQLGIEGALQGTLRAQCSANGTLRPLSGQGNWNLELKNAHWKSAEVKELLCAGSFGQGQLHAAPLRILTPKSKLNAEVDWSQNTLRIHKIALEQWGAPTLSGSLELPIHWDEHGAHWNQDGQLAGQLIAQRLDLASLLSSAGTKPPLSGFLSLTLSLSGSPSDPQASLHLLAKQLSASAFPKLGSGELELKGAFLHGTLSCDATLQSPLAAPLKFSAQLPIPLPELLSGKIAPEALSGHARLLLQGATLRQLPSLLPGFQEVQGTFSLDASFSGSYRKPSWKGTLSLNAPLTHFVSYRFPAIADLHASIDFDEKAIRLKSLRADLGGGTLAASGTAHLDEKLAATLDFRLQTHEVLVVRSRELLLRLNGDLQIRGPWNQATISGEAFAAKSRVTRDLYMVPVSELKKITTPPPLSGPGKPWFTFQRSPFSEWKFNVRLHSQPQDPLLIRGNRLRGTASADLFLRGTGGAPTLEGHYETTDLVASLPFARFDVSRGHFWYLPNQPFHTLLDFSGETEVRNHRIYVYLDGTLEAPKVQLRSEPPLAETDLLTLVFTGVLPGDTNENGQALAGRAAAVLFQDLSDKVLDYNASRDRPSALRRFSLDVGALNTRTGHQETTLSYRISDQFFVIGALGANGDFGGQIKYLLRFR